MENSSKKKQDVCDEQGKCRDRLSELPDEILVQILSFLPIRDAVRSVLLRRFGELWSFLPTLKFEGDKEEFVRKVMEYHKCPTMDELELSRGHDLSEKEFIKLTNMALSKKAKVFRVYSENHYYNLPSRFFTNQYIVSLTLYNMSIKLPNRVHMKSLRKLELFFVSIDDKTFKVVISGSPCLQELVIMNPDILHDIHFTSPSIEKLELDLCLHFAIQHDAFYSLNCPNLKILHVSEVCLKHLKLIDVSSVREAKILYCRIAFDRYHFEKLIENFRNAEFFRLEDDAYMQLKHCGSQKLTCRDNQWIRLALRSGIQGGCLLDISTLLRNSWRLKQLIIYADVGFFCNCNLLLHDLPSPCVMEKLITVTIREYEKPCKALLQLIEFLLKSAVVLEKMVIVCNKKDQLFSSEGQEFYFQLLSFPRASRKARVIFA
ncbi:hypothetical protein SOVF_019280 [Spinacia oleracea]|uniref:F-box/FBD/LRR-repeat protein At2g04230-like n=1 Tax=Spinacia oleracea TaxID=3562 RepID=A0A9R0IA92_SPIOL|nr:F-box/FBD/LRR-repeat protein At2g04230-like [Spinacia oleracea]KNA23943.1 hypothetical protein SOVF_019280 [Spinacia oleracea]